MKAGSFESVVLERKRKKKKPWKSPFFLFFGGDERVTLKKTELRSKEKQSPRIQDKMFTRLRLLRSFLFNYVNHPPDVNPPRNQG